MTTRRAFIGTLGAGLMAAAGAAPRSLRAQAAFPHPAEGIIGLQLYSLRHLFEKGDVAGTLAMVRKWGFREVEVAGTYGLTPAAFAAALQKAGLRGVSTGADYNALAKDPGSIVKEAQALGAQQVMCAWIPHEGRFAARDVERAVPVFTKAGRVLRDAGLRFLYHVHGYEFQQAGGGTLFDRLAAETEPGTVDFQMDVFWVVHGGADPIALFEKYPKRFPSTHLKDMRRGTKVNDPTGHAPDDTSVPLGQGTIDIAAILRAANRAGVKYHFIEDEHPQAEAQIPKSLEYLAALKG